MSDLIIGIVDDLSGCTVEELCQRIALERQFVEQCVEQGIAEVVGASAADWIFTTSAILRIRKAWRLHRDLDIQVSNLALVLELLDERDLLQQQVAILRGRLQEWEDRD
jgi:chaperone modulatory protein CbpM